MNWTRRRQVGISAVLATIAAAVFLMAGGASAITVLGGNLSIKINGHTTPGVLPKHEFAPIGFHGSASVSTRDGTHIPPAQSTELLIDKHIKLDTTGLPTCTLAQIKASTPAQALKACGDALLGRGTSTAQVQFVEQPAFEAKGPLLAFNGPSSGGAYGSGYNEQLYYVYANVPAPTALIAVGKVSKATGKYGYAISISIPRIAGGAGSFKSAEFTINRKWAYKGVEHSFLNAECANRFFAARVKVAFGDGTDLSGVVLNPCRSST